MRSVAARAAFVAEPPAQLLGLGQILVSSNQVAGGQVQSAQLVQRPGAGLVVTVALGRSEQLAQGAKQVQPAHRHGQQLRQGPSEAQLLVEAAVAVELLQNGQERVYLVVDGGDVQPAGGHGGPQALGPFDLGGSLVGAVLIVSSIASTRRASVSGLGSALAAGREAAPLADRRGGRDSGAEMAMSGRRSDLQPVTADGDGDAALVARRLEARVGHRPPPIAVRLAGMDRA